MVEDWRAEQERWLAPYLGGLGNEIRRRMCPAYIAGLIGRVIARASSQWRLAWIPSPMTGCITSSEQVFGTAPAGSDLVEPGGRTCRW